ncbi:MAG: sporulation transcription factor Spo0A [Clostridia bacterium]|nr:sporulation transcription factor Spo0A [Clostridia bacterium]
MEKIKMVIVDDSAQMKKFAREYFENHQQVELLCEINDGAKAIDAILEHKPDVVLLDLVLPNRDGYAVLADIAKITPMPKVIVTTALSSSNFVHKAMQLGACYFMVKPLNELDLDRVIQEQVRGTVVYNKDQKRVDAVVAEYSTHTKQRQRNMDERLGNIFITVGIPAHIKGYQFLREAIKMAIDSPEIINSITKKLYPSIAERFDTSPSKVERAIRHAIEVAWNRGKIENINSVFGLEVYGTNEKPTNGEFIALLADKMLVEGC